MIINIEDGLHPEDCAMVQALTSRSPAPSKEHLAKVAESGSGKFMDKYYVGYGHKSIGDCGSTTIFIDGVSMLCAKAIQDWRLYSGQESSTRYLDYSRAEVVDPFGTKNSQHLLDDLFEFYHGAQDQLIDHLKRRYPRRDGEKKGVYRKAIKVRSFDILRSFLPAGTKTNLTWHTNLRQAADKLAYLRHHPLLEVRKVAEAIHEALKERYSHSFTDKVYEQSEHYRDWAMKEAYYYYGSPGLKERDFIARSLRWDKPSSNLVQLLLDRPQKTELPPWLDNEAFYRFTFLLDFGSYRDIQRHRSGVIRMPLLTTEYGFGSWYLEQLPGDLIEGAEVLLERVEDLLADVLDTNTVEAQNLLPMGYMVPINMTFGLSSILYLGELRASRMVHPTLRKRAVQILDWVQRDLLPVAASIHKDLDGDFFADRGTQDIVEMG